MKTFSDYTTDQQNDFYFFHAIKSDLDAVNYYYKQLLDSRYSTDEIDFHNKLVKARSILDVIIKEIKYYENETEDNNSEDD